MQCAYCLSEIENEANVCKFCKRDVYLFRPLLAKVKELEAKLAEYQSANELQARVDELEALLIAEQLRHAQSGAGFACHVGSVSIYLCSIGFVAISTLLDYGGLRRQLVVSACGIDDLALAIRFLLV